MREPRDPSASSCRSSRGVASRKGAACALAAAVCAALTIVAAPFAPILAIAFADAAHQGDGSPGRLRIAAWSRIASAALAPLVAAALALPLVAATREAAVSRSCEANLRQLGVALKQYIDTYGGGRFFPYPTGGSLGDGGEDYKLTGAQFLASLYWTGKVPVVTDPDLFLCPTSGDDNKKGELLGRKPQVVPPRACSYASRGTTKTERKFWPLTDMVPPNAAMACDDTEGPPHHRGLNVLFADGHVEFHPELNPNDCATDPDASVGRDKPVDVLEN